MRPRPVVMAVCLCTLAVWGVAGDAAGVTLSRGRQIQLEQGLQIQALARWGTGSNNVAPTYAQKNLWLNSNFTTLNFWNVPGSAVLGQMPAGTGWSHTYYTTMGTTYLSPAEMPYVNSFVSMQYSDELTDLGDPTRLSDMAAKYAAWKSLYPKALVYTNVSDYNAVVLANYMNATQPDMLSGDYYPGFLGGTMRALYYYMKVERDLALAGYTLSSGGNSGPIPYSQYLNLFRDSTTQYPDPYKAPLPSESFIRLQQNASWAYGYTSVIGYVYDGLDVPVMFNAAGQGSPTPVYNYVKEANRQSLNLGPALVRLVSTDIFMKAGSSQVVALGHTPWTANAGTTTGYTDYMTGITPTVSQGGATDSTYSRILVGYFKPLLATNANATFVDGLHFMIVNGSEGTNFAYDSTTGDSAANSSQWYHLTFDFLASDFDSLVRLSRDTGAVELVSLTHYGAAGAKTYYLDLNLDGGTGDLFGFWNSSQALPTIPEPGTFVLFVTGLIGVLAYVWRRRS